MRSAKSPDEQDRIAGQWVYEMALKRGLLEKGLPLADISWILATGASGKLHQ